MRRFFQSRKIYERALNLHLSRICSGIGLLVFIGYLVTACSEAPDKIIALPKMEAIQSPLQTSHVNPRYFTNREGRAIFLAGASTWTVLQDRGRNDPPKPFGYETFLDTLIANNLNFFRMFVWEQPRWSPGRGYDFYYSPLPFARTGPGKGRRWEA